MCLTTVVACSFDGSRLSIPFHELQLIAAALNYKPMDRRCGYCSADITSEFANCRHVISFLKSDSDTNCLRRLTLASSLGSGGANGGLNPMYQIGGPRSIQLALKVQF